MTIANLARRVTRPLILQWAFFGGAVAGLLSVSTLIIALQQASLRAALAGLSAILSGALVGAVAAVLFQAVGRLRFWLLALGMSAAVLAYVAATREPTRNGTLLIWVGLVIAIALSLWHLSAYGLHGWRTRRRLGGRSTVDNQFS